MRWSVLAQGIGLVGIALGMVMAIPNPANAFGDQEAFDPRVLQTGNQVDAARPSAPGRWSWEIVQRTSAPARLKTTLMRADDPKLVETPFLYWSGSTEALPLTSAEIAGLRTFFSLGGMLFVDDAGVGEDGEPSVFGKTARVQVARVLPTATIGELPESHVIYRSFYLLKRPEGRIQGRKTMDAIVRGGAAQVVFSAHDLGGALAHGPTGDWEFQLAAGGERQRQRAIRLAVNIAMYVLCSNYKDDQVHAPFLMRRRALAQ